MKLAKLLFFSAGTIIFTLACAISNPIPALPANTPTATLTEIPTITPFPTQTSTPSTLLQPTPVTTPFPAWVTDFSDPILVALVNQKPDFQDDFSPICIYKSFRLEMCPSSDQQLYFQDGFSVLNQGWFYIDPNSRKRPFYAHIQDEALFIKLPEGTENRDSMVYNPRLIRKNFVLNFDFQFDKTQPDATARFQFDQTADQSVALDLSKNKTWTFHWGFHNDWKSRTGTYDYFPPERINIMVIMRGKECAVYLNNVPLDYFSDCRSAPIVRSSPWAVSFHVLATPGNTAVIVIDNVKLWDLDKIHGLP